MNQKNEEPIRVLQVTGVMNRGGAETMIMNLYRHMDRERVQFDFVENSLVPGVFDEEIRSLGGRIYYCPHYNGKNHFAYQKWWEHFWNEHAAEYRVVHGHIGSTAAFYLAAAKKHGVYTIAHSHGADSTNVLRQSLYSILSFPTRRIADYFFACSEQAGIDRFGKKVAAQSDRYRILNNAVDTTLFGFEEKKRMKKREELSLSDGEYVLGHVGRFTEEKNHEFLLDIFAECVKRDPSAKLLLIGDGPLRQEMEEKAERLRVADRVQFLGVRSDVSELMQAMDLLLFPSKNEGLPVTLVEAQTAGLPCVISDSIPKDCILCGDLVTAFSLSEPAAEWAMQVLSRREENRRDHSHEVAAAGFDITETSKWLEGFYLDKAKG